MKRSYLASLTAAAFGLVLAASCAFNVSTVKQQPVTFMPQSEALPGFVSLQDVKVILGTGYPTFLKRHTRWHAVGSTECGTVFVAKGQIVTVEKSHTVTRAESLNSSSL
jgi:hypothetical protein